MAKAAPAPPPAASLRVKQVAVASLVPYARNARVHPKKQIDQIVHSIRTYGFNNPVLTCGKVIVAGHGRVMAAEQMGLKRVPCIDLPHLSDSEMRAYILADNKLAEWAGWDDKLVGFELSYLRDKGADVRQIGFKAGELSRLLPATKGGGQLELQDEKSEAPEAPADPASRPGDLWLLGGHRLLCGDATAAGDVARLLDGGLAPNLMVTDPPYGVEYDPDWRNQGFSETRPHGNARALGKVENDDQADWSPAWALFKGAVAYVWHAGVYASEVDHSLRAAGFAVRAQIIWRKQHFAVSRGHYHWQHEPCWYAVRKNGTSKWQGARDQTTVWDIANAGAFGGKKGEGEERTGHGTQKPVECMARPIANHTEPGEAVYDPFLGSGTSIIAAHQLGRVCYGLEIDPAYCDIIIRRWQTLAGQAAVLDGDGRSFDDIAAERRSAAAGKAA